MKQMPSPALVKPPTRDAILNKDRWHAEELGISADQTHSSYYLNFSNIKQHWLKEAVKLFVRFQSSTRSYSSCRSYIAALTRFSNYLYTLNNQVTPNGISRKLVIGFFEYLKNKNLGVSTRRTTIVHLRTFHLLILQENWLPWPEKPLIYSSDIPKDIISYPRYIPDSVVEQLIQALHHLEPYMRRFTVILLETGRRISEVCTLQIDCLEKDSQGDWYMQVKELKLKKIRLIPISNQCLEAVKEQQQNILQQGKKTLYLFPAMRKSKSPHISARNFNIVINNLSQSCNIKDINGKSWHFSAHQFRHTIGTSMINNGVPQVMVQQYLGHDSPEMTSRYAHIHNKTLKKVFKQYEEKLIDIHGRIREPKKISDAQWLKKNIMSQALPNGLCALPLTKKACPHANACLTCTHFCTSKKFLSHHKKQLENTNKIINNAKENGWERIIQMNSTVSTNLKSIITKLEEE